MTTFTKNAGVAQLVEQLICNQQVAGSSPIASYKNQMVTVDQIQNTQNVEAM
jgi:hypothetical protein